MELGVFAEIGLLITVATLVSLLMRLLRQPLIVGHIITGFLVGHFALGLFQNMETLELFSELGISFLLFSVGLTLNPKVLKEYGKVSVMTGFGQVILTGGAGVIICMLLGFNWVTSLYVGVALAFSSTVIVLKLLSDKGDLDKLYVKLSIGSLLLQDLIAIVLLFLIPFVTGGQGDGGQLLKMLAFGSVAGVGVFLFSHYTSPPSLSYPIPRTPLSLCNCLGYGNFSTLCWSRVFIGGWSAYCWCSTFNLTESS
jgi:Kef-type K+ transport system membrane component KefB